MTTDRVLRFIRTWAWLAPLAVGLPGIALYFLLAPDAENVAYEAFGVCTTLAVLAGVVLHRPRRQRMWLLLGLGFALWTAGDIVSAFIAPVAATWRFRPRRTSPIWRATSA